MERKAFYSLSIFSLIYSRHPILPSVFQDILLKSCFLYRTPTEANDWYFLLFFHFRSSKIGKEGILLFNILTHIFSPPIPLPLSFRIVYRKAFFVTLNLQRHWSVFFGSLSFTILKIWKARYLFIYLYYHIFILILPSPSRSQESL